VNIYNQLATDKTQQQRHHFQLSAKTLQVIRNDII